MPTKTTDYTAVRVMHDSAFDFEQTRARFDERVPAFDPVVSAQLVIDAASWPQVQARVDERAGTLYAPFRVAIYRDATGVHVSYDKPSSVFASLGSPGVNAIAAELDKKISTVVEESCR
jgi:hypothetical protein